AACQCQTSLEVKLWEHLHCLTICELNAQIVCSDSACAAELSMVERDGRRTPWLIQAARYSVTGVINTVVGLSVIFLALAYGASDIGANMLGYGIALWVSFYLNRRWTFDYHGRVSRSLIRFVAVLAAAYCCNLAVVLVSHRLFEMNVYLAQVFGTGVY